MRWYKGVSPTGEDSIAKQIVPADHWPQMRALILVVNDSRKKYSSTSGMKLSVDTSDLIKHRAEVIVPRRVDALTKAIINRDFTTFGEITMKDSNQMHAVCLDTFPPCVYMNDTSQAIVNMIHAYNELKKGVKVCNFKPLLCMTLYEALFRWPTHSTLVQTLASTYWSLKLTNLLA